MLVEVSVRAVTEETSHPDWVVHAPQEFRHAANVSRMSRLETTNYTEANHQAFFNYHIPRTDGFTDGELIDVVEHFFWGKQRGLAMDLGALDGTSATRSMTQELEQTFGWRRILVEGNPTYAKALKARSFNAFSVSAAICGNEGKVHYSGTAYVGGILEFMDQKFLQQYHPAIFNAQQIKGNISTVDWTAPAIAALSKEIDCVPLSMVLHKAHTHYINFFVLDVEGGELEVLRTINWQETRFDVLCIETDPPNRPAGYRNNIAAFLGQHGYIDLTGQVGRNTWFVHKTFKPSTRPGLNASCFNGFRKSDWSERWYVNRRIAPFEGCPIATV
jgi:hypothetical protein